MRPAYQRERLHRHRRRQCLRRRENQHRSSLPTFSRAAADSSATQMQSSAETALAAETLSAITSQSTPPQPLGRVEREVIALWNSTIATPPKPPPQPQPPRGLPAYDGISNEAFSELVSFWGGGGSGPSLALPTANAYRVPGLSPLPAQRMSEIRDWASRIVPKLKYRGSYAEFDAWERAVKETSHMLDIPLEWVVPTESSMRALHPDYSDEDVRALHRSATCDFFRGTTELFEFLRAAVDFSGPFENADMLYLDTMRDYGRGCSGGNTLWADIKQRSSVRFSDEYSDTHPGRQVACVRLVWGTEGWPVCPGHES